MSEDPTDYLPLSEDDPPDVGTDPGDPVPVPEGEVDDSTYDPELEEVRRRELQRLQEEER